MELLKEVYIDKMPVDIFLDLEQYMKEWTP